PERNTWDVKQPLRLERGVPARTSKHLHVLFLLVQDCAILCDRKWRDCQNCTTGGRMRWQPLEDGRVTVSRAAGSVTFPCQFMLVAAMNPCPCGYFGDLKRECRCGPVQVQRYRQRISGPLLDRIDLHIEVPAVEYRDVASQR